MQMAAPKPQSTGELSHVCFCPYLSPTALCWVSVTAAPKAFWLLTPRDRCGELWAPATLQETRHSRRAHTLPLLKPQISFNKRPDWEDILAFNQQRRKGSHHHLSLPHSQWELAHPWVFLPWPHSEQAGCAFPARVWRVQQPTSHQSFPCTVGFSSAPHTAREENMMQP